MGGEQMIVKPKNCYVVEYRNADGQLRRHEYQLLHHARQFARAMASEPHITEVRVTREESQFGNY